MAKRKEPQPPVEKRVIEVISQKHLDSLLNSLKSHKRQAAQLTGSMREKIAYAQDKQFLYKPCLPTVEKLDKMEPEELALWFSHFDHMCDARGLRARAESAPGLNLGDQEEESDETTGRKRGPRGVVGGTEANVG